MALEYFLYTEDYNNTLIDRSDTSFAPLTGNTGQIHIDFLIPETQPLYLFKEDAGLIVENDDATVNSYLEGTAPATQPNDPVFQETFTGYTGTTEIRLDDMTVVITGNTEDITNNLDDINYISGVTDTKLNIVDFNGYSGDTLADINTRVYRSGDTMTGSLSTSGNLTAVGAVTGSSVSASVLMTTPVLNASTSICAPQITGSTCITTPISCATTRMQAPVVCGGICSVSPITIGSSCLCSLGTTGLDGGVTAASFLNVSGETTLNSNICWVNPNTGGTLNDYGVKWDPVSKQLRTIATTGSSANVYCYCDKKILQNNTTTTNADYINESWSLSAGYYESEFNAVFGNTSANRCAVVCFLINGNVVGSCNLMKTNAGVVRTTAYITQNGNLSGGTHTISMVFNQIGGGVAQIHYGAMRLQKIGESI